MMDFLKNLLVSVPRLEGSACRGPAAPVGGRGRSQSPFSFRLAGSPWWLLAYHGAWKPPPVTQGEEAHSSEMGGGGGGGVGGWRGGLCVWSGLWEAVGQSWGQEPFLPALEI